MYSVKGHDLHDPDLLLSKSGSCLKSGNKSGSRNTPRLSGATRFTAQAGARAGSLGLWRWRVRVQFAACMPPTVNLTAPWLCPIGSHEPLLRSIINGLFAEGLMPAGSIVDAGANTGEEACMFAERQRHRIVHAVEPVPYNAQIVSRRATHYKVDNLKVLHGGLGNQSRRIHLPASLRRNIMLDARHFAPSSQETSAADRDSTGAPRSFQVYRLDDLFATAWAGETLGFFHLDVEGLEVDVMHGSMQTILRDLPVLTVEVFPHNRPNITRNLLEMVGQLGYRMFVVEEQCGIPADCRNILCLPIARIPSMRQSAALDLAHASYALQEVTPLSMITTAAYAPVCRGGGSCCRQGPAWRMEPKEPAACCGSKCVQQWLSSLNGARSFRQYGVHSWSEFEGEPRKGRVFQ